MKKANLVFFNLLVLVVFVALIIGAYTYISRKNKGEVVLPAGINYTGSSTTSQAGGTPSYDYNKLTNAAKWLFYKGRIYKYTLSFPEGLTPLSFPNDPADAVTFKVSSSPPETNLMFLVETISSRDKTLVGKPEDFVKNYWKFFSGLKGLNSIESFTNGKGLIGFKATYLTKANSVTNANYFFIVPGDDDHMLHAADIFPTEGQALFEKILNSISYGK